MVFVSPKLKTENSFRKHCFVVQRGKTYEKKRKIILSYNNNQALVLLNGLVRVCHVTCILFHHPILSKIKLMVFFLISMSFFTTSNNVIVFKKL